MSNSLSRLFEVDAGDAINKLVFITIALHSGLDGRCRLDKSELMQKTELSSGVLQTCIDQLCQRALVTVMDELCPIGGKTRAVFYITSCIGS